MNRCQCKKNDGKQCTRDANQKIGQNTQFCWQHQNCKNIISQKTIPKKTIPKKKISKQQSIAQKTQQPVPQKPQRPVPQKPQRPVPEEIMDAYEYFTEYYNPLDGVVPLNVVVDITDFIKAYEEVKKELGTEDFQFESSEREMVLDYILDNYQDKYFLIGNYIFDKYQDKYFLID